jgi:hypothetical protein
MKIVISAAWTSIALVFVVGKVFAYGGTNFTIHSEIGGAHFCMDASLDHGVHDGDPVYVFHCTGRENQRWTLTQSLRGETALIGVDGYCLDVRGAGHGAGTPVQLYQCHFQDNQRFIALPDGHIKEVASGKCLAALGASDRAPVVLDFCQASPNQIWLYAR